MANDQQNSAEIQSYDQLYASGDYSADRAGYKDNFVRFIETWLGPISALRPRILDVGCGDGYFTKRLAERGDVTATDFSEAGLARARRELPQVTFFAHDLGRPLPLEDNSFDAAWCSEVLEHLFAPAFVTGEIYRVLKPGGLFLITVPYHGLLKNLGIALFAFEKHYNPDYPHIRYFTYKTMRHILERHGFVIDHMGSCGSELGLRDWFVPTNILCVARKPLTVG